MLSREELSAWLRLAGTPGVGNDAARRLLAAFASPESVFAASEAARREVVGAPLALALSRPPDDHERQVATTWAWLHSPDDAAPRHLLVLGDPAYPPPLLQTADPPLMLYAIGRVALLRSPAVAIVGSRSATPQGLDNAREFAHFLSQRGLAIVSGLALGIDAAAHAGGLEGPGSTVAFVGTGLDSIYPRRNEALGRRIMRDGVMASEYALGMPAIAANFPRRNRLIAGLAKGTLVIEAALQSGSLITARMALEAGREVFAIPGSIHSPLSRGCHRLIQQGAKLVETGEDILQELLLEPTRPAATPSADAAPGGDDAGAALDRADAALLAAMGHDPASFDALAARTGLPSETLSARLLELELGGRVQRLPGGLYQRRGRA
jgi:DNA processing protein